MGDRYRDDRYSPPRAGGQRWDRDRMEAYARRPSGAERDRYQERDRYEEEYYMERRREPSPKRYETRERVIYKEEDRFEVPYRPKFRYDEEPDRNAGAMVHRPREREDDREIDIEIRRREYERLSPRRSPPREFERPKFVRRQSSLDTYDRKPMPRYGDVARVKEETVMVPRRRSPPRYREPPRFDEYEEIRISEQDRAGREELVFREREVSRVRVGDREREYDIEETEEIIEERPAPKKGKTKMPLRLVNVEVLVELGYPFEQENETIMILKALHKDHIDEVIALSRQRNARHKETKTTYIIDGKEKDAPAQEEIITKRTEIIREITPGAEPSPKVPRSVREWDVLSKSTHKSSRYSDSSSSSSPTRTVKSRKSRARSVSVGTRREIIISNDRDESATIRGGVGALIVPSRERRKSRDIQQEIVLLEAERRALRKERHGSRGGGEVLIVDKDRRGGPGEVVILEKDRHRDRDNHEMVVLTEKDDEVVQVRRDKRAPDPKLIKSMLWTLT